MSKLADLINKKNLELLDKIDNELINVLSTTRENFCVISEHINNLKKARNPVWKGMSELFKEAYSIDVTPEYLQRCYSLVCKEKSSPSQIKRSVVSSAPVVDRKAPESRAVSRSVVSAPAAVEVPPGQVRATGEVEGLAWSVMVDGTGVVSCGRDEIKYGIGGRRVGGIQSLFKIFSYLNDSQKQSLKEFIKEMSMVNIKNPLLVNGVELMPSVESNFTNQEFYKIFSQIK